MRVKPVKPQAVLLLQPVVTQASPAPVWEGGLLRDDYQEIRGGKAYRGPRGGWLPPSHTEPRAPDYHNVRLEICPLQVAKTYLKPFQGKSNKSECVY